MLNKDFDCFGKSRKIQIFFLGFFYGGLLVVFFFTENDFYANLGTYAHYIIVIYHAIYLVIWENRKKIGKCSDELMIWHM